MQFTKYQKELLRVLIYNPYGLEDFIALTRNKQYAKAFLQRMFPRRVGIELDYYRNFTKTIEEHNINTKTLFQNSIDFSDDGKYKDIVDTVLELRLSWDKIEGFKDLYKLLELMNRYCKPYYDGGLHIHNDMTQFINAYRPRKDERIATDKMLQLLHSFSTKLAKIAFNYKGDPIVKGSNMIQPFRGKNSIEYRMGFTHFDYPLLVKQILCTQYTTSAVKALTTPDEKILRAIMAL